MNAAPEAVLDLIAVAETVAGQLTRIVYDEPDRESLGIGAVLFGLRNALQDAAFGAQVAVHGDPPDTDDDDEYAAWPPFLDAEARTDAALLRISEQILMER